MELFIPRLSGHPLPVSLKVGSQVYLVGANGSGKSALIQHFAATQDGHQFRRIAAHRQTWPQSGNLDFTARARREFEQNSMNWDRQIDARWRDHSPAEKQAAVLFDLVAKDNTRYRTIGQHVDNKNLEGATAFASKSASLFKQLNDLLDLGTLTISLRNSNDEEILAQHRNSDTSFSIAQMSDGERAAVIMAANVLTVEPKTVLLIDEPERHLHRSIIEPFLSALFAQRNDCAFVVSTHEIALPIATPKAQVLLVRSCEWQGKSATAWEVEVLEPDLGLPEDLKQDILGSRPRILFVEGTSNSLDLPLYSTIFPSLSVIPKGSCNDVVRAVKGLRGSHQFHHIEAFGLIDKDDRSAQEIEKLAEEGVFALSVCSAESLYYCSDAIAAVAHRQADSLDCDSDALIDRATQSAMEVMSENELAERMAARRCETRVRSALLSFAPNWRQIKESGEQLLSSLKIDSPYTKELSLYKELSKAGKLDDLIARYPVKDSNVFDRIAKSLECNSKANYERMLVSCAKQDESLADKIKQRIKPLSRALGT